MAAISGVSFAIQLFDSCVKGYNFMVAIVQTRESYSERRLKLIIQYQYLLSWGKEVGLMEQEAEKDVYRTLGVSILHFVNVLSQIRMLLDQILELYERHEELRPGGVPEDSEAEQDEAMREHLAEISTLCLDYVQGKEKRQRHKDWKSSFTKLATGIGGVFKHPRSIRWVLKDEGAFDNALRQLQDCTGHLRSLVGDHRLKSIEDITKKTLMEMVQLVEEQGELVNLVGAAASLLEQGESQTGGELQVLRDLASLKEISLASGAGGNVIQVDHIWGIAGHTFTTATFGDPENDEQGLDVWIQWKPYGSQDLKPEFRDEKGGPTEAAHNDISLRVSQLAALLESPKPADLCTPDCVGYFDDQEHRRFGWVFAMPAGATNEARPETLRWLLSNVPAPSLSERVALASRLAACVLYLHAVNWVHKAFRSDNIWFVNNTDAVNLLEPTVSGFGLSRPDVSKTLEVPQLEPERDVYRWPSTQGTSPDKAPSRKTGDIYSLGIILLEIAHWKPIEDIMEFDMSTITIAESKGIRARLVDTEPRHLLKIPGIVGNKYHNAVKTCLEGPSGFDLDDEDDQTSPAIGVKLQRIYMDCVVQQLKKIRV